MPLLVRMDNGKVLRARDIIPNYQPKELKKAKVSASFFVSYSLLCPVFGHTYTKGLVTDPAISYAGNFRLALFNGAPQYLAEAPFNVELDPN